MRALVTMLLATPLLSSCATSLSSSRYAAAQVGSINRAVDGEVISVRPVTVDRSTGVGGAAGAGLGALGGAALGSNTEGAIAGAIVGAVAAGVAGAALERSGSQSGAYEYVVRTDNGALLTLVQGEPALGIGARVIVIYGSPARLIPKPAI